MIIRRIAVLFPIIVLCLVGSYFFWDEYNEITRERWDDKDWVEKKLEDLPEDLNTKTIKEIKKSIEGSRQFKFAVMGDTRGNYKILRILIRKAREAGAEFLIYTGDLVGSGSYIEYKKATELLKKIELPLIFVLGNHDHDEYGYILYYHCFGPVDFYFDVGDWRFICVENNEHKLMRDFIFLPDEDLEYSIKCGLDEEQLEDIEQLLNEKPHNFMIMHQPPEGIWDSHVFERGAKKFLNIVSSNSDRIGMVFMGHIHAYSRKIFKGIPFIISGAAGARLHKRSGVVPCNHFVLVSVNGDKVSDKVYFLTRDKWTVVKGEETLDAKEVMRIIQRNNQ